MKIIKRNGSLQEFNKEKLITSIKNSAKDCNYPLTHSDINYLSGTAETEILKLVIDNRALSSQEIRMTLYETLKLCHFEKVANAYIET